MTDWKEDYDWQAAFSLERLGPPQAAINCTGMSVAPFTIGDVAAVIDKREGENDAESWIMIGQLADGRYFYLTAWCDYTGWG